MNTPQRSIQQYLNAKDSNRPHVLSQAFAPDAILDMVVRTGTIAFPPHVEGLGPIGDVLVRRFGQTFENVYTFCLGPPPAPQASTHQCQWLVGMSDKNTGEARVGCGVYEWHFNPESALVTRLTITIEHMKVLPATDLDCVMAWVSGLNYPWCGLEELEGDVPDIEGLEEVVRYVLG